jgi:hypothetical protein
MQKTNLSYELLEKYLPVLLKSRLIDSDERGKFYSRTAKGQIFLKLYEDLSHLERKASATREFLHALIKDETEATSLLANRVPEFIPTLGSGEVA